MASWGTSWGSSWGSSWGEIFPAQFAGLKVFDGSVLDLCLVAAADAPDNPLKIRKGGADYAVYLVDTDDPNASRIRIETPAGVKAIRLKT